MTEIEFAALLVSRVCHDLVGPLGAVVNGLEVLEDERDAVLRADALKIVGSSAEQALARLQFLRLAYGAAGSAGTELSLQEVAQLVGGLFQGGRVRLQWQPQGVVWPKDWAKLLMNVVMIGVDCLPRGGVVRVENSANADRFTVTATGDGARISPETRNSIAGDGVTSNFDPRGIQQVFCRKIALHLQARILLSATPGAVEIVVSAEKATARAS